MILLVYCRRVVVTFSIRTDFGYGINKNIDYYIYNVVSIYILQLLFDIVWYKYII